MSEDDELKTEVDRIYESVPSYMYGVREGDGDNEITMDESIRMKASESLQNKKHAVEAERLRLSRRDW